MVALRLTGVSADENVVALAADELAADLLELPLTQLPSQGLPAQAVAEATAALKAMDPYNEPGAGLKKWGGIYHGTGREGEGGHSLEELQTAVSSDYLSTNALYAGLWPSIQKFEREILAMTLAMLNGGDDAVGLVTSGGTESILLAILSYREWGKLKGIGGEQPEVICGDTAHPALCKACFYFGLKLVVTAVDPVTQRIAPDAVRAAITPNTVAIYASAPNFPNGRVDPVVELGELAVKHDLGLHVDNCLGGFYLSFAQAEGLLEDLHWDFRVPGVTSISVDVHKYGMSTKGVSVVAFANPNLRRGTFKPVVELLGTYITPTMQGSRNGVGLAIAWATMVCIGENGYRNMARDVHTVHSRMKEAVNQTDGIELVCDSDLCIVPITSATLDVKALAGAMAKRGWSLFASADPQPRGSIEVCVGTQHVQLVDQWCEDLSASVLEVTNATAGPSGSSKSKAKPRLAVSAYDAVGEDGDKHPTDAEGVLRAKLRERLIAYVEGSLALSLRNSSSKL